jgi:flagellar M-ring protein FliF
VLLSLHPGRMLDRAQIAGIVHLVASSVPEMEPAAVSVVDDTGKLLSQSPDGNAGGVDMQQFLYTQQVEQQYVRRILDILEPVVGKNNVKAQVSAELDFSQTESTSEQHRPNQSTDGGAVRSQQVMETNGEKTATPPPACLARPATSHRRTPPRPSTVPILRRRPLVQARATARATSASPSPITKWTRPSRSHAAAPAPSSA